MARLQVRLIIAVAFVALLAITAGTALAAPSMQTDMPPGVTVSAPVAATLAEGGTTTYTVVLDALPTEEVTVVIAVLDKAENPDSTNINLHTGSGTPAANLNLMFTTTNWNMAQTVTITAVNDTVAEADLDYIITHTVTGSGHTDFRADDVDITVSANDPLTVTIGATASTFAATVAEGGSITVSVVLSTAPATGNVSVALTSNTADVTRSPSGPLIFSSTTYNTAQMVTLTYQDNNSGVSDAARITFTPTGGGGSTHEPAVLSLTSINDDIVGFITDPQVINAREGGNTTFTIKMATEPSRATTFFFDDVVEDKDIGVAFAGSNFTFTPSNWNTPQTVTITVPQDLIDNDPDTITIRLKRTGGTFASEYGHYEDSPFTIVATRTVDETRGLEIEPTFSTNPGEVRPFESSSGDSYTVRLTSEPTADVTVTITNPDSTQITIDESTLTFTDSNWNVKQTVLVTAVDDDIQEVAMTHIITHTASGGDYGSVTGTIRAIALSNDFAGVDFDPDPITVTEGSTGTIAVMLDTVPAADVTVTFSTTSSDFTISSGASLTFNSGTWNTAQDVTVTPTDDDDGTDHTGTITAVAASTDGNYNALSSILIDVSITDDDVKEVTVNPSALTVGENGGTGTLNLKLATEPTGDVTVTITSGNTGIATVNDTDTGTTGIQNTLTFTTLTWDTTQAVTVMGVNNDIDHPEDQEVEITLNPSGADYNPVAVLSTMVTVTQTDEDMRGVTVTGVSATAIEGGADASYTVKLNSQPMTAVLITPSIGSNPDVTVSPSSHRFNTINWATPMTFTVMAVDDDFDENADDEFESVTITHGSASTDPNYAPGLAIDSFTVMVEDDDTRGVTITPTEVTVIEGHATENQAEYTVVLNSRPTGSNVEVTFSGHDGDDFSINRSSIIFTSGNWNSAVTVTVTVTDDFIDEANEEMHLVGHTLTSMGDYSSVTATINVTVTVEDNDDRGLEIVPFYIPTDDEVRPLEGSSSGDLYTVRLTSQPTDTVTVTITNPDSTQITIDKSTLEFMTDNWNVKQTVNVKSIDDDLVEDGMIHNIAHAADGGDYGSVTGTMRVVSLSNDDAEVVVDPASITVIEGSTGTIAVKLESEPTDDVTVTLATTSMDFSVTGGSLTFTSGDWDTVQNVTVTPMDDVDGAQEMGSITVVVASTNDENYNAATHPDIDVTITDNDSAGLEVSASALTVAEDGTGNTATFDVKLLTQPTGGSVTVAITSNQTGRVTVNDTDTGTMGYQYELTFTTTNWATAQTVTITGVNNNIDHNTEQTTTITINPSGADYDSVADSTIAVTITDGDMRGITLSRMPPFGVGMPSFSVDEGGPEETYMIVLDTEPTAGSVIINLASDDTGVVTVSPASLTFTKTGAAIWSTPHTVRVMGVENNIDHLVTDLDSQMTTIEHTVEATGDYSGETLGDVTISVEDNDTRGVTVTPPTNLTIAEGATTTYSIVLASEPTGNVTVNIGSSVPAAVSFDPVSHQFTPSGPDAWNNAVEITLTAEGNLIDHPSDLMSTISHEVSTVDTDYVMVTADSFDITVTDDDTAAVLISRNTLTIDEAANGTYDVWLMSQPSSGSVVVTITDDHDEVTISPAMLTFETGNWSTRQTVTVRSPDDRVDEDEEMALVSHSVSSGPGEYTALTNLPAVTVTLPDDDTRGVKVSNTSGPVNEGETGRYSLKLESQPTSTVTITVTIVETDSDSLVDARAMPNSLMFTTANWENAQTVSVFAIDDDIDEGIEERVTMTHVVTGGDYETAMTPARTRMFRIQDNDFRGVTVSPTSLNITEGETQYYDVKLNSQPTADVTITITKVTGGETTLGANKSSLMFTAANWDDVQPVGIAAAQDNDSASDETATFTHAVSGGDYGPPNNVTAEPVTANTVDNDANNVSVSTAGVTVTEGGTAMYTVRLTTDPEAEVTLGLTVSGGTGDNVPNVRTTETSITFTGGSAGTWGTPQTVTVESPVDPDAVDETATISHAITSGNYTVTGTTGTVQVEVNDPDNQGVTVTGNNFTIEEGEMDSYTVMLNTQPYGGNVTVEVENLNTADLTSTPSLTFNATDWDTAQTVTLEPVDDDIDDDSESVTLTHKVTGADYTNIPANAVNVAIDDNDDRGVIRSKTSLRFREQLRSSYTIVLNSEPLGTVTIDLAAVPATKLTVVVSPPVIPPRLTFTPGNWDTAQTVTLIAPHDDDVDDEQGIAITHVVNGSDYGANNVTVNDVNVDIDDDDEESITITPTRLRFVEGRTAFYFIVLNTQPSAGQVVSITILDDSAQVRVTPAQLEFTRENWDDAQRVTVQSLTDADELNDIVNITHRVDNYGSHSEDAAPVEATVAEFELEELAELGVPQELTATAADGKITLRWKSPVPNDDGRVPTSYQYRYTPTVLDDYESSYSSGLGWIQIRGASAARFAQVSGLINQGEYTFQVRGVDAALLAEADSDEDLSTMIETQGTYIHLMNGC